MAFLRRPCEAEARLRTDEPTTKRPARRQGPRTCARFLRVTFLLLYSFMGLISILRRPMVAQRGASRGQRAWTSTRPSSASRGLCAAPDPASTEDAFRCLFPTPPHCTNGVGTPVSNKSLRECIVAKLSIFTRRRPRGISQVAGKIPAMKGGGSLVLRWNDSNLPRVRRLGLRGNAAGAGADGFLGRRRRPATPTRCRSVQPPRPAEGRRPGRLWLRGLDGR